MTSCRFMLLCNIRVYWVPVSNTFLIPDSSLPWQIAINMFLFSFSAHNIKPPEKKYITQVKVWITLQSRNHNYNCMPTEGVTIRATWTAILSLNIKAASFGNSDCWVYQLGCSSTLWHLYSAVYCKAANHSSSKLSSVFVPASLVQHSTFQGSWSQ